MNDIRFALPSSARVSSLIDQSNPVLVASFHDFSGNCNPKFSKMLASVARRYQISAEVRMSGIVGQGAPLARPLSPEGSIFLLSKRYTPAFVQKN